MSDESDSAWRDMKISGNTVTGNSTFDHSSGYPVYDENGLQLSINTSKDGDYAATIDVKQGFAGAFNDALTAATKDTTGSVDIDSNSIQDEIDSLNDRISEETTRLAARERSAHYTIRNLEATLTQLKSQLAKITGLKTLTDVRLCLLALSSFLTQAVQHCHYFRHCHVQFLRYWFVDGHGCEYRSC